MTDKEARAIDDEMEAHYRQKGGRYWRAYKERRKGLKFYNIPTTRRKLLYSLFWHNLSDELQAMIAYGREHPDYKMRLAVYAWQIYTLFRYVYVGKNGEYKKLSAERYARELFLDDAESPEELRGCYFTDETRETGFRIYTAICNVISPMMAHNGGDRFWPDHIAFLVDYIIKEEGNVPVPETHGAIPYPLNYPHPHDDGKHHFLPGEIAM